MSFSFLHFTQHFSTIFGFVYVVYHIYFLSKKKWHGKVINTIVNVYYQCSFSSNFIMFYYFTRKTKIREEREKIVWSES